MSRHLFPAALILAIFILARPLTFNTVSAAPDVASTTLLGYFSTAAGVGAFNYSQPSGSNPTIFVLSNSTLRIGTMKLPPSFTITLKWVAGIAHNFHIYSSDGTISIGETDFVDDGTYYTTTTTNTFTLRTGVYKYQSMSTPASCMESSRLSVQT